jgi:hypothetical protein
MPDFVIRCSSLGLLMGEPMKVDEHLRTPEIAAIIAKTKRSDEEKALLADAKNRSLSDTARSHIRELVAQDVMGIDFIADSKQMQKGRQCEQEAIDLINRVRGLSLVKNSARLTVGGVSGEWDLFDDETQEGIDAKCAWNASTFPIVAADIQKSSTAAVYEWQARGYIMLKNAKRWGVSYVLLDTPPELIGYEPTSLHVVGHIPERMRLTTWTIERDAEKEAMIAVKVAAARAYYAEVLAEFERTH